MYTLSFILLPKAKAPLSSNKIYGKTFAVLSRKKAKAPFLKKIRGMQR
jgi:hypothetical protein